MVAVPRQKIVRGAQEFVGRSSQYGVDLFLRGESEAVQDLAFESATWRLGLRFGPVHAGQPPSVMAAIGIFSTVDDDSGV